METRRTEPVFSSGIIGFSACDEHTAQLSKSRENREGVPTSPRRSPGGGSSAPAGSLVADGFRTSVSGTRPRLGQGLGQRLDIPQCLVGSSSQEPSVSDSGGSAWRWAGAAPGPLVSSSYSVPAKVSVMLQGKSLNSFSKSVSLFLFCKQVHL